jgi:GntR family transcriptional repressor for pyruvate dehydrogenase complex
MFGVSRTALREALQMLSARDLISIKKGSGIYVNELIDKIATKSMRFFLELNFDKDHILHVIKARNMFEPEIAKLAAINRKTEDIDFLKNNIE